MFKVGKDKVDVANGANKFLYVVNSGEPGAGTVSVIEILFHHLKAY
jgi:hypothetical protein